MTGTLKRALGLVCATALLSVGTAASAQETHEIMARGVKFAPLITYIQPGDEVSWTNMPSHNVATLEGQKPEGVESFETELGETVTKTFDEVGIITYKCSPHWGNRMGGFIVVGEPEDAGAIIDAYMQNAEEVKENLPSLGLLKKLRKDMTEKGMIDGDSSS